MKLSMQQALLFGILLALLAGSFGTVCAANTQVCGPETPTAGYTVDAAGNVLRNGSVLLATRNGVKAVSVTGNDDAFSVTFQYKTWQGTRQYHAIYVYNNGAPFAWNASKSTLISSTAPLR